MPRVDLAEEEDIESEDSFYKKPVAAPVVHNVTQAPLPIRQIMPT